MWEKGSIIRLLGLYNLSLVYTSAPNSSQTTRERFMNQMHVCVDRAPNLHCADREWFAYRSLRTKIYRFFARTQRELDVPGVLSMHRVSFPCTGVLCSPQVRGKLINRTPLTHHMRTAQHVSRSLVYTKL